MGDALGRKGFKPLPNDKFDYYPDILVQGVSDEKDQPSLVFYSRGFWKWENDVGQTCVW